MDNLFDLDDFENIEFHETPNNENNTFKNSNNEIEQNPQKNEKKEDSKIIKFLEKKKKISNQNLSKNNKEKKEENDINNLNKSISNSNSIISEEEELSKTFNSDSYNSENEEKQKSKNGLNESTSTTNLKNQYAIEDQIDIEEYKKIKNKPINYNFELDTFQKRSIIRLENHQNVLVCAHTSSGKTVIAEYGIALGKRNKRKVLYTSPIKALSNQKYRDFKIKFNDVGILTGDVTINPDAQCLIMTTEILQNSLYKNSELLNSVEWVIFDEVHYINDNERGHVWEEILILLPPGIGIIMLSATIPNYMEFAEWVGKIKKTTVYVQNTLKRIVPLEYKIFLDNENVFMVKNINNEVFDENIKKALFQASCLNEIHKKMLEKNEYKKNLMEKQKIFIKNIKYFDKFTKTKNKNKKNNLNNNKKNQTNNNNIQITKTHLKIEEMVNYVNEKSLTPAVIFVFSIKKINEYAKMLKSKLLITNTEIQQIRNFYDKCINTLSNEDKEIPQIQELREMLINGIGIHHSGLLPILKEIIEILYSKGLIKILFATTSFSIGLNMPTRTVVFTDIYKYNDKKKEILTSSEFLQMSGRAGRRGIDSIGHVFLMITEIRNQQSESKEISNMLKGTGTEIESKFRLSYRTVISFFSRNIKGIDQFFKESFLESKNMKEIPKIMKELEDIKIECEKLKNIECRYNKNCFDVEKFIELDKKLEKANLIIFSQPEINIFLLTEENNKKSSQGKGRILRVYDKDFLTEIFAVEICYYTEYNGEIWCVIYDKKSKKGNSYDENNQNKYMNKKGIINGKKYIYKNYDLSDIREIYDFQIPSISDYQHLKEDNDGYKFLCEKDLKHCLNFLIQLTNESINEVGISPINYLEYAKNNPELEKALNEKNENLEIIKNNKFNECSLKSNHLKQFYSYLKLIELKREKEKTLDPKNMEHYMEFNTRLKILQKLGYIDEHNIVTLKGKAAREIGTTDCVLISELLVSNILEKLNESEIIGFISGFCSNKNEIDFNYNFEMSSQFSQAYNKFEKIFKNIEDIEKSYNFEDNKYDRRITFSISKAMISWMNGKSFSLILKETDLEEGKLYSLILRIYMFLEEIINFYVNLGNKCMSEKYENIKKKLMRDIMSKESLYLQDSINI